MVKCKNCGYLTFRHRNSRELVETEERIRIVANLPREMDVDGMSSSILERTPICFARATSLRLEIFNTEYANGNDLQLADQEANSPQDSTLLLLFDRERYCTEFTEWQQGFTPKEHRETRREDDWQKFQVQLAEDDRKWREKQEVKAEQRHQLEIKTLRGIHKGEMWVMGLVVTLVIVIFTLLGGAMEANWIPKWFGVGQDPVEQPVLPSTPDTPDSQP